VPTRSTGYLEETAIKRQEAEYSWHFVFLGANMDAVAVGHKMGFDPSFALTYDATGEGVTSALTSTTDYVSRQRRAHVGRAAPGFSAAERDAARGATR
jgi:hypothetical protein